MQTALFFEDRLARFKHTVVFKESAFASIQQKVRALEILLEGKPSVMTEARIEDEVGLGDTRARKASIRFPSSWTARRLVAS